MKHYRITNRQTKERQEVTADSAHEACQSLGWQIGQCYCEGPRAEPFTATALAERAGSPGLSTVTQL